MAYERIVVEVSVEEYRELTEKRDGKTWRELFLPPLGIETKRQRPGPDRKSV